MHSVLYFNLHAQYCNIIFCLQGQFLKHAPSCSVPGKASSPRQDSSTTTTSSVYFNYNYNINVSYYTPSTTALLVIYASRQRLLRRASRGFASRRVELRVASRRVPSRRVASNIADN